MASYDSCLKDHLSNYKVTQLGVSDDGIWKGNGKSYSHILPECHKRLNILETIREQFWAYLQSNLQLKLHMDFHHLNSSQAMCFNLFFPFFGLPDSDPTPLLAALGLPAEDVDAWEFEFIPDPAEGTNFDFWIHLGSDSEVFFEIKLSESAFGSCKPDESHKQKREGFYRDRLKHKCSLEALEDDFFFENYQLLRNLSYVDRHKDHSLIVLLPKENKSLTPGEDRFRSVLLPEVKPFVKIVYMESLLDQLRMDCSQYPDLINEHLDHFEMKYRLS